MTLALHGKSKQRQWLLIAAAFWAMVVGAAVAMVATQSALAGAVTLNPAHVGATNPGFDKPGSCPTVPLGADGPYGWHFVARGNANFTSLTVTFEDLNGVEHVYTLADAVQHPDASHAYIFTPAGYTLVSGSGVTTGTHALFNLSHICTPDVVPPDTELEVAKTADTDASCTWAVTKTSNPTEANLLTGGTVDVSYDVRLDLVDCEFSVSGTITVTNTGTVDASVNSVTDSLDGAIVTCTVAGEPAVFPVLLVPVGDPSGDPSVLSCIYKADVDDATPGINLATANADNQVGGGTTNFDSVGVGYSFTVVNGCVEVWDDAGTPDNDTDDFKVGEACYDDLDLPKTFDSYSAVLSAGSKACTTKTFINEARVVGDEDEVLDRDDATVVIRVYCDDTAWAANGNGRGSLRYNTRGIWATYVQGEGRTVNLYAGQTHLA
ncbi:MAG TPA: hypothetical protein PJ994_05045, partial [Tepidiformaceae bacterium]|nr:hypothetical protein [Tepidiformaceae bacterium]